jgi:integrase
LVNQFSVKIDAEFDQREQSLLAQDTLPTVLKIVDEATAKSIGRLWVRHVVDGDEAIRQMSNDAEFEEREKNLQDSEQFMRQALARGKVEVVEDVLMLFLTLKGITVDCDPAGRQLLCKHFLNAYTEALQLQRQRSHGEIIVGAEIAPEATVFKVANSQPNTLTLKELFEDWRDAIKDRNPTSVKAVLACITEFDTFMQSKSPLDYKRNDLKEYSTHLEIKGNKGKTIGKKIGFLSTIFNYAVDEEKLLSNPASMLIKSKPGASKRTRLPYSISDIQKILGSKIFTQGFRPKAGAGEAVVWLPLLGLVTGARLEELAQLLVEDVVTVKGIGSYVHISDCDDDQHLKTDESRRRIPLHPDLLKAGFLRYVKSMREAGQTRLFPDLVRDSKRRWSGNWSKFWGRFARAEIGITDKRKVFHSLRHTFKDLLRETECDGKVSDVLMGHSDGSMGSKYGSAPGNYPLAPLFKAIKGINLIRAGIVLPVIIK